MKILGISAYYHDSAASLIDNGNVIAAAQEERFTRKKHDASFPFNAIQYCLSELGSSVVDYVVFYEKPITKFSRLLHTYIANAPWGRESFLSAIPIWVKNKLFIPAEIKHNLKKCGLRSNYQLLFSEHHHSHAASAFFPSPFEEAVVITLDGVGEWTTTSVSHGKANNLTTISEIHFPHSLGLLYSAFTYYTGFKVNSGEYKLMGLAPYGEPKYVEKIKDELIEIKPDGSFRLNLEHLGYLTTLQMTNEKFHQLFGGAPRTPESSITKREMDLACSIQVVTEEVVEKICRYGTNLTGIRNLCLAGGVALNCVSNGKLLRKNICDNIWVQPASGDAGGALGAAFYIYYHIFKNNRFPQPKDAMYGAYLGPSFSKDQIETYLNQCQYPYESFEKKEQLHQRIAELISQEKVIGLLQGRMEYGPRALGNRSIIGDARSEKMQSIMNLKIKYRESFRPFAPSCLEEDVSEYFEMDGISPYMLLVASVKADRCLSVQQVPKTDLIGWVNQKRSDLPAITHVDYSARIQSVSPITNPDYYSIITKFKELTGYGIIINTSFNVRGEPIVCTPEDAYQCFMRTEMDYLVLNHCLLTKKHQPVWEESSDWQQEFVLD